MTSDHHHVAYRKYYEEADVLSIEGILKLVAILGCIVSVVTGAFAARAGPGPVPCGAEAGARLAGAALASAAVLVLLLAAAAARLPLRAPLFCLYTDLILTAVAGAVIFVIAVLNMALCNHNTVLDYVNGPVCVATSCAVTASSAALYRAATRALDSVSTEPAPVHSVSRPFYPQHHDV